MKSSIKKIFANLSTLLILLSLLLLFSTLLIVEQNFSFEKIKTLNTQKEILTSLRHLEKRDINSALIEFQGKSTQLHHQINHLRSLYGYDITGVLILANKDEYFADLQKLSELIDAFNQAAQDYYTKEKLPEEQEEENEKNLHNTFRDAHQQIDTLLFKDITYNQKKSELLEFLLIFTFVLLLFTALWYKKRLKTIYADIFFLYSIDSNKKTYTIFSEEVDAIALRMKRKPSVSENPNMLDPLTGLNNNKGMYSSYAEKKGMKDENFTSVTILEVDNFSKTKRAFTQDLSQAILKKIAFTISLHEQATDVIARTDYNQFAIIFSRSSKEQLFKDIDMIRQGISELNFKGPNREDIKITVSGGFFIKPNSTSLEEAIRQSKEILYYAQTHGTNKIAQKRDMAEHEL